MTVFREARLGKQKLRTMDGNADALGVVPAHTYARLRFDEAAEQAVQHLGYVLQMHQGSPYQGQFVARGTATMPSNHRRRSPSLLRYVDTCSQRHRLSIKADACT